MKQRWQARWLSCTRSGGNAGHPVEYMITASLERDPERVVAVRLNPREAGQLVVGLSEWLAEALPAAPDTGESVAAEEEQGYWWAEGYSVGRHGVPRFGKLAPEEQAEYRRGLAAGRAQLERDGQATS